MSRTYFQYDPKYRAPRGNLIIDLQRGLAAEGTYALSLDGVFAGQTQTALTLWQARNGLPKTGAVDALSWTGLTRTPIPSLFRRCLGLTAAYEGQGYDKPAGNFDGAGLTWGIIGFTLGTGDLGPVLKAINARAPQVMIDAFGDRLAELMRVIDLPRKADRVAWADAISVGKSKKTIVPVWDDAFVKLGGDPLVRQIQDEFAYNIYWKIALGDVRDFGKPTEMDAALFFDTAVQSGGVRSKKHPERLVAVQKVLAGLNAGVSDQDRLTALAGAVAKGTGPWEDDVRSRRLTFAQGSGVVHQTSYRLANWGLDFVATAPGDLA